MPQAIDANFIGKFKVGDNIHYNLDALAILYEAYVDREKQDRLRKLIIVQIGSILDAILYDFFFRAVEHNIEGIRNVPAELIAEVQDNPRRADKFDKYIRFTQRHNVFDAVGTDIYDNMHELRKLRNRIHIQNERDHFEANDEDAFTENRMLMAEQTLQAIMQHLSDHHSRGGDMNYVGEFVLPW